MFGLGELKQTKVDREARLEGKLENLPCTLEYGLSWEDISRSIDLPIEPVREEARK
ncbi:hypothetical protein V0288_04680 [Pannus brasiliensis CCIBt3594]|uniref:Uncharacterized protein n=1 Tax=Pannus brasiliensis CCIBt3594 TaxID=1427578 RepID=A0AAW9QQB9_9CHRO